MNEINEYSNVNYCKKLAHKEITHIDLPSNIIKRYAFINIHNPSYYDVELYTADPMTDRFIKPFCKIYQNSYLSVEIPSDMTLNGLFLYPVYNMNNSVDYCEDIYLTFSKHSNYWNEKGKMNNNINLKILKEIQDMMDPQDPQYTISPTNDVTITLKAQDDSLQTPNIPINLSLTAPSPTTARIRISGYIDDIASSGLELNCGPKLIFFIEKEGFFNTIVSLYGNNPQSYNFYISKMVDPDEEFEISQTIKNLKFEIL